MQILRLRNMAWLLLCVMVLISGCAAKQPVSNDIPPPPMTLDEILAQKKEGSFAGARYDEKAVQKQLQQIPGELSPEETYTFILSLVGESYTRYRDAYAYLENPNYNQQQLQAPNTLAGEMGANLKVVVVLDCSGSMAGSVPGGVKMDLAKQAVYEFVAKLPPGSQVGLRVFGHKGSSSEKDKAEGSKTELVYPITPYNEQAFAEALQSFSPRGWTPIAKSLNAAWQDLSAQKEEGAQYIIYLVSDGIETCGGDPVAVARSINQSDIQAIVNIIGFDVDDEAQQQLKEAAAAGGGNYVTVKNQQELQEAFQAELKARIQDDFYNKQKLLRKISTSMSETSITENKRLKAAVAYLQNRMNYKKWSAINQLVLNRWIILSEYQVEKNLSVSKKILDESLKAAATGE